MSIPLSTGGDTALYISLAGSPGNFGPHFHNFLYAELGLDYVYKAFTITDLAAAIGGVRAADKRVISGAEVARLQALEQFVLYTGVRPSPEQAARAAAFAQNTAAQS